MTSNSMDVEAKPVGFPSTLTSRTCPKNTKSGQEGTSVTQPAKNQAKDDKVSLLSLVPQSDKHSCDPQIPIETGKEVEGESSIVCLSKHPPSEAQEATSPLKPTKELSTSNETTNIPIGLGKGNWKRIAQT